MSVMENYYRNLLICTLIVILYSKFSHSEEAESRALELPIWRPLHQHHQRQAPPQQQLISVANFDSTSSEELSQIALHNAHILQHYHQPITQYHNPQQSGHTPGPKYMTTPVLMGTNTSPLFVPNQKSDVTFNYIMHTTPRIPQTSPNIITPMFKVAKFSNPYSREPMLSSPAMNVNIKMTPKPHPHPVMNKLQAHLAMAYRQKPHPTNRLEQFPSPSSNNNLYSTFIQFGQASPNTLRDAKTKFVNHIASQPHFETQLNGLLNAGVGNNYQQTLQHIKYLQKMNYMKQQQMAIQKQQHQQHMNHIYDNDAKKHVYIEKETTKSPASSTPMFPQLPPSILTPFFQQVQVAQQKKPEQKHVKQQSASQSEFTPVSYVSFSNQLQLPIEKKPSEVTKFQEPSSQPNEVRNEYSKDLVPPPPSPTYQPFLPTVQTPTETSSKSQILNKYNINSNSPLQDANRFSYRRPSPTPITTTTTTYKPTFSSSQKPSSDDWRYSNKYITTEKPFVFKNLFRPQESEYKQHKLMHPAYTGKPVSSTTPFLPTPVQPTEDPFSNPNFFTIEDAIPDPTVNPMKKYKNKIKVFRDDENKLENPIERQTVSPLKEDDYYTTTVLPIKTKNRRRRPRPPQKEQEVEEYHRHKPLFEPEFEAEQEQTPKTRTRLRLRPENNEELKTTSIPEEPSTTERLKLRKVPNRNRVKDEEIVEQIDTITTTLNPTANRNNRLRLASNRFKKPLVDDENVENTEIIEEIKEITTEKDDDYDKFFSKPIINKPIFRLASTSTTSTTTTSTTTTTEEPTTLSESSLIIPSSTTTEPLDTSTPLIKNDTRPRFSIKDFRNKINRMTTPSSNDVETTTSKFKFPTRNRFILKNKTDETPTVVSTTERIEEESSPRPSFKPFPTRMYNNRFTVKRITTESSNIDSTSTEAAITTQPAPTRTINRGRIRVNSNNIPQTTGSTGSFNNLASRRPTRVSLRQRIQNYRKKDSNSDSVIEEQSTQNIEEIETENTIKDEASSTTTERYKPQETSIMKIASKDSQTDSPFKFNSDFDLNSASSDYSQRVVELTLSANKDHGFKSVNKGLLSRRVPGYFTLATEDPILPIEAFFPQVKNKTRR